MYLVKDNWSYLTICKSKPSNNAQKTFQNKEKMLRRKARERREYLYRYYSMRKKMNVTHANRTLKICILRNQILRHHYVLGISCF